MKRKIGLIACVAALAGSPLGAQPSAVSTPSPAPAPAPPSVPPPASPAAIVPLATDQAPPPAAPAPAWLAPDQYLFASGEAAALSRATWAALVDFTTRALSASPQRQGVVLAPGSTLEAPRFVPCEGKPPAVVADVDESAILNVGWQYDDAAAGGRRFDRARWQRWEQTGAARVAPTPGAVEAVSRLRALGVEVIFVSNREAAAADGTARALAVAGLGRAEPGRTLFLRDAAGGAGGKDALRARIAADHCVLAMLGDQLGDFSDLFDAAAPPLRRRAATTVPAIADMWGEGWFLMPNPLYGSALRGTVAEVFPAGLRWTDPGPAAAAPPSAGSAVMPPSAPAQPAVPAPLAPTQAAVPPASAPSL